MKTRVAVMVSGMVAADPHQGGATWALLQYVLGLIQLGHDVCLVEPIQRSALRPVGAPLPDSENARYFERVATDFGLRDHAALVLMGTKETFGLRYDALLQFAHQADLLINVAGMLTDEALSAMIPIRVYLDLDPAFNQLWCVTAAADLRFAGHTHYVTVGQAIGEPECPVPTCGLPWRKTLQPVVLDRWPMANGITCDALTTIGNWRSYGSITHQGVTYGQKAHSLRTLFTLPERTQEKFLLAMAIHPEEIRDLEALSSHGWQLVDPARVADTPQHYQRFIQGSKAEFGIAKSGYVLSRCGWFSDRSVCYLASGRPVLAQETGFSRYLPVGEGLFAFEQADDVLEAIEALRQDYSRHSRAARRLAEEYFDSARVLRHLLDAVGVS